jgi:hypothetical protein
MKSGRLPYYTRTYDLKVLHFTSLHETAALRGEVAAVHMGGGTVLPAAAAGGQHNQQQAGSCGAATAAGTRRRGGRGGVGEVEETVD